jgi:hypothetical protein
MESYRNQIITREKLEELFNENNSKRTIVTIEYNEKIGTAFKLENIKDFKLGDIMVFWENGEQTKLPEKFRLLNKYLK